MSARMAALRSDIALLEYPEHIPKATTVPGLAPGQKRRAAGDELGGILEPFCGVLFERFCDRLANGTGCFGAQEIEAGRWLDQVGGNDGLGRRAGKRRHPREHLVRDDSKGIYVSSMIGVALAK